MELNDKYRDHPNRDEIIAKEMGRQHKLNGDARDWDDEVDEAFEQEDEESGEEDCEGELLGFERHPIYMKALAFNGELDELHETLNEKVREHPAMNTLNNQVTLATAKLAAALSDEDVEELGMSIAYLKRALAALNAALDATTQLRDGGFVPQDVFTRLRASIFGVRDDIVTTVGEYRAEFRRRHGHH